MKRLTVIGGLSVIKNYTMSNWALHRREAIRLAAEQKHFLNATKFAYNGDATTVKQLTDKSITYQQLIDAAKEKAADTIFEENNRDFPTMKIDLHGLYVREAILKLSERIDKATRKNVEELNVVVGRGRGDVV